MAEDNKKAGSVKWKSVSGGLDFHYNRDDVDVIEIPGSGCLHFRYGNPDGLKSGYFNKQDKSLVTIEERISKKVKNVVSDIEYYVQYMFIDDTVYRSRRKITNLYDCLSCLEDVVAGEFLELEKHIKSEKKRISILIEKMLESS